MHVQLEHIHPFGRKSTYLPMYLSIHPSIQLHVAAAIVRILWVPKLHYRDHKIPPLVLIQSQMSLLHAPPPPCYCCNLSLISPSHLDPNLHSGPHRCMPSSSRQFSCLVIKWFNFEADLFTSGSQHKTTFVFQKLTPQLAHHLESVKFSLVVTQSVKMSQYN